MKKNLLCTAILAAVAATGDTAPRRTSIVALSPLRANGTADLTIYGYIGAWLDGLTALDFVSQINATTATTINVYIDSDGGVVHEALAIYTALRRHPARIVVYIDGIAASAASAIAMAGDEVHMPAYTRMMVHGARGPLFGTAQEHREIADEIDGFSESLLEAYAAKVPAKRDELKAILSDRADRWFSAAQAVEFGLADSVLPDPKRETSDAASAVALLGYIQAISAAPADVTPAIRSRIQAAARPSVFASLPEAHQRAVVAHIEDITMRNTYEAIIVANANGAAVAAAAAAAIAGQPAPAAAPLVPGPAAAPAVATAAPVVAAAAPDPITAIHERNTRIQGVFATFRHMHGIQALESECLADPRITIEAAQNRLLERVGAAGQPLNGGFRIEAGRDEGDTQRQRTVDAILARAGVLTGAAADTARQGNPHAHSTLLAIAESSLIRAGVNTRGMDREQLARAALAVQTTSDFPVMLENTLHRMVIGGYTLTPFTWSRFCSVGTLSDYRPHNRYHLSSFSDLKEVNEAGEYENGVLGDAKKETITGKRKGRILQITPEVLINDDLGGMQRISFALGQAAGRTIEKDVYALFALNSGAGPTMNDGLALFHTSHANIAATGAAPSVTSFDLIRQQLASQKDPGDNDYLDIAAAIWLGPLSLGGLARQINAAEYDDESQKNQKRPNIVRGMFRDIVDTPRLPATVWYAFADPNIEPVFEVAFLGGIQQPRLEQETNFRTDGLSWKVTHRYGVAGVGTRGAIKNAGV